MKELKVRTIKKSKRLGRGYGSGKGGHNSSRGTKGQKARSHVGILFEGVKTRKSLLSRLPFIRGKAKFKAKPRPFELMINQLNVFKDGAKVDLNSLVENKVLRVRDIKNGVKVLNSGELTAKKLVVSLSTTSAAREKIESLGGKVE